MIREKTDSNAAKKPSTGSASIDSACQLERNGASFVAARSGLIKLEPRKTLARCVYLNDLSTQVEEASPYEPTARTRSSRSRSPHHRLRFGPATIGPGRCLGLPRDRDHRRALECLVLDWTPLPSTRRSGFDKLPPGCG